MNARQRRFLVNMNRVLIFALTAGGLLTDGPQLADLTCTGALVVWLWLPLCARLEARLLRLTGGRRGAVRLPGASPFV
jgi:hypothetical protein